MPEKYRALTTGELDQMYKLLRQGCQPWEIALSLGRSDQAVRHALRDDSDLASELKEAKTGRWSALEVDLLAKLLDSGDGKAGLIAQKMGRRVCSVQARIRRIVKSLDNHKPSCDL
jgi:hypothetical protein